ncbi:MAG: hypothetical protein CM1200mP29_10960 [Verrucomicrobiota bacterium]|nr:MAG: hypothetical protein CM1200mP29_10960 [Verrucomicrobiota bacterium]
MDLARRLAKAGLEAKLAACANIVPAIESHYWWEGKLESSNEALVIFKTRQEMLPKLERSSGMFTATTLRNSSPCH